MRACRTKWTKFGHITFLVALVLAVVNLYFQKIEINAAVVVFMLLALLYDITETKKKR